MDEAQHELNSPPWGDGPWESREQTLRAVLESALAASVEGDTKRELAQWEADRNGSPAWWWIVCQVPLRLAELRAREAGFLGSWAEVWSHVQGLSGTIVVTEFSSLGHRYRVKWDRGAWMAFDRAPAYQDLGVRPDLWREVSEFEFPPVMMAGERHAIPCKHPECRGQLLSLCHHRSEDGILGATKLFAGSSVAESGCGCGRWRCAVHALDPEKCPHARTYKEKRRVFCADCCVDSEAWPAVEDGLHRKVILSALIQAGVDTGRFHSFSLEDLQRIAKDGDLEELAKSDRLHAVERATEVAASDRKRGQKGAELRERAEEWADVDPEPPADPFTHRWRCPACNLSGLCNLAVVLEDCCPDASFRQLVKTEESLPTIDWTEVFRQAGEKATLNDGSKRNPFCMICTGATESGELLIQLPRRKGIVAHAKCVSDPPSEDALLKPSPNRRCPPHYVLPVDATQDGFALCKWCAEQMRTCATCFEVITDGHPNTTFDPEGVEAYHDQCLIDESVRLDDHKMLCLDLSTETEDRLLCTLLGGHLGKHVREPLHVVQPIDALNGNDPRGWICQWNPSDGRKAVIGDPFHGVATVARGKDKRKRWNLCSSCASLSGAIYPWNRMGTYELEPHPAGSPVLIGGGESRLPTLAGRMQR